MARQVRMLKKKQGWKYRLTVPLIIGHPPPCNLVQYVVKNLSRFLFELCLPVYSHPPPRLGYL